ncbi:hypothetical protein O181_026050 [Austropuccinia psidii MF-1]|uniref:Uncharacterized protein n=1 Tax=Austropuccinia psidii MF-1 TaxID=1389203 RepID=A0A9Q3CNN4_9BASI|nr:hypothetical protein [Austropuccinia psidii MF-1]
MTQSSHPDPLRYSPSKYEYQSPVRNDKAKQCGQSYSYNGRPAGHEPAWCEFSEITVGRSNPSRSEKCSSILCAATTCSKLRGSIYSADLAPLRQSQRSENPQQPARRKQTSTEEKVARAAGRPLTPITRGQTHVFLLLELIHVIPAPASITMIPNGPTFNISPPSTFWSHSH